MTIYWQFEKTRPAVADGGIRQLPASRCADTQYLGTDNVIRFPALTSLPDNSRASECELFIQDDDDLDSGVACVLAVLAGFLAVAIGVGLFVGSLIFNLI